MPAVNIKDLALAALDVFNNGKDVTIEVVGRRPGEKLHEELLSEHELDTTFETEEMYIILPDASSFKSNYEGFRRIEPTKGYRSDGIKPLSVDEIKGLISSNF
jgi:FlaA1/EpsC-like NDP-sugar epimerase